MAPVYLNNLIGAEAPARQELESSTDPSVLSVPRTKSSTVISRSWSGDLGAEPLCPLLSGIFLPIKLSQGP